MKTHTLIRTLLIVVVMAGLMFMRGPLSSTAPVTGAGQTLRLEAPPFVRTAYAQENSTAFDLGAYLDQEAGISAYYQAPVPITINSIARLFRTIEISNTDYIIGSISVPNYPEPHDTHVYVNKDGWMLAYYLKVDPASKIIDWNSYNGTTISTTKLRNVLVTVADAAGSPLTSVTYYDFRYPNATNMMIVAESTEGTRNDSFEVTLPSSFAYYERSWSLFGTGGNYARLVIDGTRMSEIFDTISFGTLTASQLLPDVSHTVEVQKGWTGYAYGGITLVYRVP